VTSSTCSAISGGGQKAFGWGIAAVDMAEWLETYGLAQYSRLFDENDIDLEILPDLTEADLEKLGISLSAR
jgi:hypothetical protein